jgi:hypothetical protein
MIGRVYAIFVIFGIPAFFGVLGALQAAAQGWEGMLAGFICAGGAIFVCLYFLCSCFFEFSFLELLGLRKFKP